MIVYATLLALRSKKHNDNWVIPALMLPSCCFYV
ncbi:hypothetical protein EC843_1117 [Buttiauxella sp. JUb87]|nr:hypothetical protein EC843_1117 [Buttiauxella sp. JUb87]